MELNATDAACRARLGQLIFGQDDTTLPQCVAHLLTAGGKTIASAESCTGGLLAGMLTEVPGSSRFFLQGYVTYTNESKMAILGVSQATLRQHGAVSEPVVKEMAEAARRLAGSDFSLSVSGIAGPDGGTAQKPVGTVCFGFAHAGGTLTRTVCHFGDRDAVRDRACKTALTILRCHLIGAELPF
jgi:PncC family amidohydrolase